MASRVVPPVGLDDEIARLRDLDLGGLRARWHSMLGRKAPPDLPRHLLFRILAYRLQADRLGDLDKDTRRALDRIGAGGSVSAQVLADLTSPQREVRPGTILGREWNGHVQRVMVMEDGFTWNGQVYRSLSEVAFAITGTRWNGPRFFGLRDKPPHAGGARR
jgi:hypothetical protein